MLTPAGPKVIEFNCRFGDPETQPLMVRLKTDLLEVLVATVENRIDEVQMDWDTRTAICVVMTAGGYPGSYEKGKVISGLADAAGDPDVQVFHAGTRATEDGKVVTNGGRVLGVTGLGSGVADAQERAYGAVAKIYFPGVHFRRDIGDKALK
jgi:phosphoribosylamine--glycine ligase